MHYYYGRAHTVRPDHAADPGEVLGAGSERAVWPGPLRLAVQSHKAVAVGVHLAGAVVGAVVVAQAARSPPAPAVRHQIAPWLRFERWCPGGSLIRLLGRLRSGLVGWLGGWVRGGVRAPLWRETNRRNIWWVVGTHCGGDWRHDWLWESTGANRTRECRTIGAGYYRYACGGMRRVDDDGSIGKRSGRQIRHRPGNGHNHSLISPQQHIQQLSVSRFNLRRYDHGCDETILCKGLFFNAHHRPDPNE